ncbi:hypothetical protein glysoja_033717 [Glycine soja]|uniref:26S proteasome non-ATPase regulatory subunit 1/RPN2 N-terminal domain-containing protein n=1 Tax=Glycine soja TaxID=3848 RepID=A0A0B2SAC9_GLYSO|nr:hypothetical protein JHK86_004658 [Glycine max]KHN43716.1 hypothetical protein glysoja_033717 [Glycine soja]
MPVLPSRAFVLLFFVVPGCSMLKAFQWFGVLYHPVIVFSCMDVSFVFVCLLTRRFFLSSSSYYYYPNPNLSYSNSTPLREIMATTLVSSVGGMLAMLNEPHLSVKLHALSNLNNLVETFWPPLVDSLNYAVSAGKFESFCFEFHRFICFGGIGCCKG